MPTPIAPRISLTQNARTDLQALARAHSTPQTLALRARIILRAGEPETVRGAGSILVPTSSATHHEMEPPHTARNPLETNPRFLEIKRHRFSVCGKSRALSSLVSRGTI
jgi:hypothetical protein